MSVLMRILAGFGIVAFSFWVTLTILDTLSEPPQEVTVAENKSKPVGEVTADNNKSYPINWRDPSILTKPELVDRINEEASKALSEGRADEILPMMVRLSDQHPEQALTAYHAAVALSWTGRKEESLSFFDRAIAADHNFFYSHFNKGMALEELGLLKESCREFRLANNLDANAGRNSGLETRLASCKS